MIVTENKGIHRWKIDKEKYSFPVTELSVFDKTGLLCIRFKYKGEDRLLHCAFGCEGDLNPGVHPELEGVQGSTVWISLGMWGESDMYVKTVLEACKPFGRIFFTHNDCSDDFKEI